MDNSPRDPVQDQFEERVISVDRVARVVKGGRRFRFRALVAVGDKTSRVGVGVDKGADVQAAIAKAVQKAKNNMITVTVNDHGSIFHEETVKLAGAMVMLKPASAGTGIIAGGVVRSVLELAGIKNILSKSLGSNNKINIAYATIEALSRIVPRKDWRK